MIHTFKASTSTKKEGMQVVAKARQFEILIDEPKQMGGSDQGMTPMEVMLASLGACQAIVTKMYAKAKGLKIDDVHIDIEGDIDMDGVMHKSDVRPGFQEIRYTVHFTSDEPQEKLEAFADFVEKTCPVSDSFMQNVTLKRQAVVID